MHEDCVMNLLSMHAAELVRRAQDVIDDWDFAMCGGACDAVAEELVLALDELEGIQARVHGQDGIEHAWVIIPTDNGIVEVDIPWELYENRLGYHEYELDYGYARGLRPDALTYVFHDIDKALVLDDLEVGCGYV